MIFTSYFCQMNVTLSANIVTLLLLLSSCGNVGEGVIEQSQDTAGKTITHITTVNDMHWLEGWWQNAAGGILFEEWKINADGSLSGTSGLIKDNDTVISETISLAQGADGLMYIPTVKDQNDGQSVPFRLTAAAGDSFIFENPVHDFPDKITYKRVTATLLTATISGKVKGEQRSAVIEMEKTR